MQLGRALGPREELKTFVKLLREEVSGVTYLSKAIFVRRGHAILREVQVASSSSMRVGQKSTRRGGMVPVGIMDGSSSDSVLISSG
jgi:hypothetical protein